MAGGRWSVVRGPWSVVRGPRRPTPQPNTECQHARPAGAPHSSDVVVGRSRLRRPQAAQPQTPLPKTKKRARRARPTSELTTPTGRAPQLGACSRAAESGPDARRARRSDRSVAGGHMRIRTAAARQRRARRGWAAARGGLGGSRAAGRAVERPRDPPPGSTRGWAAARGGLGGSRAAGRAVERPRDPPPGSTRGWAAARGGLGGSRAAGRAVERPRDPPPGLWSAIGGALARRRGPTAPPGPAATPRPGSSASPPRRRTPPGRA